MKAITFCILLILITGLSCNKESANEEVCLETGIQGEWLWIRTEGGLTGGAITPENSGYTIKLEINDTLWREFTNDSLIKEIHYVFTPDTISNYTRGYVMFNNGSETFAEILGCNLTLICGFEDCPSRIYKRKK